MPWPVHPTGFFGAQGDNDTYKIERSLRFNSADGPYLTRPFSTPTNSSRWTMSMWVKRGSVGTALYGLFGKTVSASANFYLGFNSNDTMSWAFTNSLLLITTQAFRDPSSWYHFVAVWDSANATASQRARIYVNGNEITSFSSDPRASVATSMDAWNTTNTSFLHAVGAISETASTVTNNFDGYLTEINFIDGQALTPSSFGETDAITGRWKAKAYSGTYGTNGFYLKFADNSGTTATTLGKDSSGNGNNWTPNNFSVTAGAGNDSLLDSPTNNGTSGNYATLNPLQLTNSATPPNNGNLTSPANTGAWRRIGATIQLPTTGKWYFEYNCDSFSSFATFNIGVFSGGIDTANDNPGYLSTEWMYDGQNGYAINNNTSISSGFTAATTGDVLQLAYDASTGSIWFGKNNTWQGAGSPNPATGTSPTYNSVYNITPLIAQNWATQSVNFGQRPFAYTAPSGFKALCTTNLPTPTIRKPSSYMDVVTYTGTGSALTPTSSLGFSPDLVWIKGRSGATDHALYDAVRGAEKRLESNNSDAEVTSDGGVTSFDSNGFALGTLAQVNTNTSTYVSWAWDEAPIAGMDIVGYTGNNNSSTTISHSLGVTPSMIIVKPRSGSYGTEGWQVWHKSLSASNVLQLHSTAAQAGTGTFTSGIISSSPTSSAFGFTAGSGGVLNVNASSTTYIAYLFAEVEGFSRFGSYTGNGSADGPFVWCGFRPRWVMIKRSDGGAVNWWIFDAVTDSFNVISKGLSANTADAESSGNTWADMTSNGIKIRTTSAGANTSGGTYIFAAFAESPFKYARAR